MGDGRGGFAKALQTPVDMQPRAIAIADFDGDANLDVALSGSFGNVAQVLLGGPLGVFQMPLSSATGIRPMGIAAADFNGDAKPDLVTANYGDGTITILLNTTH